MTAVNLSNGPSARKRVFDITVVPGTPQVIAPSSVNFNIVAAATVAVAGTYDIEYALTNELDDYRPLLNAATAANTGLSNGDTVAARTSAVVSPGVQKLRFTATTQPTRFMGYGV